MRGLYRVVIVDDEGMPRRILSQQIEKKAPEFSLAGAFKTGDQAWAFLEKEEADILITDIKMPGMSGLELARRAVSRWPDMAVSIITGYSEFEYARQAIALGVCSFLLKPIDLQEFADALTHMGRQRREHLQRRAMQAPVQQDAVDEMVLDLMAGTLRGAERSRRFQECAFPLAERECCGDLVAVSMENAIGESSEGECSALKNVLRMNFPDCFFYRCAAREADAGSPGAACGEQAVAAGEGRAGDPEQPGAAGERPLRMAGTRAGRAAAQAGRRRRLCSAGG